MFIIKYKNINIYYMTGGLIQLVAYGVQDIFLTKDPQITYFKVVYRRHTNFSTEIIPQRFTTKPNFGSRTSSILPRSGDLIHKMYLVVDLPEIPTFIENNELSKKLKFAWVKHLGYYLIKSINIEIGGQVINKHYGEWLYIWNELTYKKTDQYDKMIGNINKLNSFTNGKDSYRIYVPLQFWFCQTPGLALPIINLQFSEVKINLELNNVKDCYVNAPTNYITVYSDIVHYEPFEYIEQTINNVKAVGQFIYFDKLTKKLYFNKISKQSFQSITSTIDATDTELIYEEIRNETNKKYLLVGTTSRFESMMRFNTIEQVNSFPRITNLNIKDCFLLIEYIFLDEMERTKFALNNHEYLINQVQYSGEKLIDSRFKRINLGFSHPCKEFVWVTQLQYQNLLNKFNFTDNYNEKNGKNIIINETINLNGNERVSYRNSKYFDNIQKYQHHTNYDAKGINVYSFGLYPELQQPSGSCNMSKIDKIDLQIETNSSVSLNNTAKCRIYALSYNILRIDNGLSGLVFTD